MADVKKRSHGPGSLRPGGEQIGSVSTTPDGRMTIVFMVTSSVT